jgi:hypothetical protein
MDEAKIYKTAVAFRTALETRLQMRARAETTDLQRLRRQVAFDRFLAREGSVSMASERRLRDGVADARRTNNQGHRLDAA